MEAWVQVEHCRLGTKLHIHNTIVQCVDVNSISLFSPSRISSLSLSLIESCLVSCVRENGYVFQSHIQTTFPLTKYKKEMTTCLVEGQGKTRDVQEKRQRRQRAEIEGERKRRTWRETEKSARAFLWRWMKKVQFHSEPYSSLRHDISLPETRQAFQWREEGKTFMPPRAHKCTSCMTELRLSLIGASDEDR